MARATARHILVETEKACEKSRRRYSAAPTSPRWRRNTRSVLPAEQGGELGEFGPGEMVPEFDEVVFQDESARSRPHPNPIRLPLGSNHQPHAVKNAWLDFLDRLASGQSEPFFQRKWFALARSRYRSVAESL